VIIKEYIKASYTYSMTNKELDLMLLLFKVHCWDGSIPLTKKQLAKQTGCSRNTLKDCILRLVSRGVITINKGFIFLTKFQSYSKNREVIPYIPKLAFLYKNSFKKLTINAKRFILEVLSNGFYKMVDEKKQLYSINITRNWHITDLYHQTICGKSRKKSDISKKGMFNLFDRKDIENILEISKKYLNVTLNKNGGVTVNGINKNIKSFAIKSYGERYSLFCKLNKSGIDYNSSILNTVYKVMSSFRDNSTSCITVIKQAIDYTLDNCLYSEVFRVDLMRNRFDLAVSFLKATYQSSFFNMVKKFIANISVTPMSLFNNTTDYLQEMSQQECAIIKEEIEDKVYLGGENWLKPLLPKLKDIVKLVAPPPLYNWLKSK
jgi:hypothetical protein